MVGVMTAARVGRASIVALFAVDAGTESGPAARHCNFADARSASLWKSCHVVSDLVHLSRRRPIAETPGYGVCGRAVSASVEFSAVVVRPSVVSADRAAVAV